MNYFLSFLIALSGIFLIVLLRKYLSLRAKSAHDYGKYSQEFFRSIRPLIEDDETPIELLRKLRFLNDVISDKNIAWILVSFPMRRVDAYVQDHSKKIITEFFVRRPELEASYFNTIAVWFLAVTALSPIPGVFARYAISEGSINSATNDVARKKHCDDHNNDGPITPHGMMAIR